MNMRTLKALARRENVKVVDDSLTIELQTIYNGIVFSASGSYTLSYDYWTPEQRKEAISFAIADLKLGTCAEGDER